MQQLEKVVCEPAKEGLELSLGELFQKSMTVYDENGYTENIAIETLQKSIWSYRAQELADHIRAL